MMKLTVLGSSTPVPRLNEPCSGYLLTAGDTTILLDCGSGIFAALADCIDPRTLSAVWISHMHPDHTADLATLANWALNTSGAPKIRVFGPQDWDRRLNAFISADGSHSVVRDIFEVEYLTDGLSVTVGESVLMTREVHHSVVSYGLRVLYDGDTFAYSGDSGPCSSLESLADNADLLLCEAGSEQPTEYHMTKDQAYELARRANVSRLLITHIPYGLVADEIGDYTAIPVATASAGDWWLIGRD